MWASTTPAFRILFQLATNIDSAEVTLAWDPHTEPDLTGYKIYYGSSSGNYASSVDTGNRTSYTLSSLEDGKMINKVTPQRLTPRFSFLAGSRNGAAFLLNYVKGCDNGTTKLYD